MRVQAEYGFSCGDCKWEKSGPPAYGTPDETPFPAEGEGNGT